MINIKQIEKEYQALLETTKVNEDKIDEFFEDPDFTWAGGVTPLQFNTESFVEFVKKGEAKNTHKDYIIKLGMLYTLIYNDTDFNGENSTMRVRRACDNCGEEESINFTQIAKEEEWKCKECGADGYSIWRTLD